MGKDPHMDNSMEPSTSAGQAHHSPHARLGRLPTANVRWNEGFWADRFELCRTTVLPHMKDALEHPDNRACLSNFRVAAGVEKGQHRGTFWSDGDCYKWLEAVAHVYAITRDDGLDGELDHWIDLIARSQDADGYICTQIQLDPDKERWEARRHHELYNMGHLMTAASVHQRATGKHTFTDVARKLADYLYGVFAPRPTDLAHFGWNPSNIMGLVDLYRVTGEKRYLELAGIFVDMRGSEPWPRGQWGQSLSDDPNPGDQNQDRVPLREEAEAVGHAVTAAYLYCGAADVAAETGEQALLEALERIWSNVVGQKMYVTGAIGAYHQGISSRHDKVHEAFGREWELPNRTAYNETCANIGNAMWNLRMLGLTGEARFADVMETVLYNSALSAMDVDGTRFCYTNPLARNRGGKLLSSDSEQRWSEFTCYCCPPQVARTLASVHEWAHSLSDEGLWVNLYGGSALDTVLPGGERLCLTQATDYPWDGRVTLTVERAPGHELALMLRIPEWAEGGELLINGEPADMPPSPRSYASVARQWSDGDTLQLDLPMRPRLVQAHPNVEETRNQVAAMRGPLVYCLESVDLPGDIPIHEVHLPRDIELVARWEPDLLGGVVTLEATGCRHPGPDWEGRLYSALPETDCEPLQLRLVPYYAWLNRGPTDMRVWLPLA
jgi:DUF1680 family protein